MEKPNYYAIIPAEVRYADIPPQAKLLYGELTALSNKEGFSWATNKYFADLYDLSIDSISRLLGILEENGFITQQYKYDSKLRANRKIYAKIHIGKNAYRQKCQGGIGKNAKGGVGKNAKDNNTSNNNTREYKEEEVYIQIPCMNGAIKDGKPIEKNPMYLLLKTDVEEYKSIYKDIDVDNEIKKMVRWLKDNHLKTKTGMPRFINGWLSRCKPERNAKLQKPNKNNNKRALDREEDYSQYFSTDKF